jgi:hypothetical protein
MYYQKHLAIPTLLFVLVALPIVPAQTGADPSSDTNIYFVDSDSAAIANLRVDVVFNTDFITQNGVSFQLNCYSVPGYSTVWQQYGYSMGPESDLWTWVNTWNDSNNNIVNQYDHVLTVIPEDQTITAESQMSLLLDINPNDLAVNGIQFEATVNTIHISHYMQFDNLTTTTPGEPIQLAPISCFTFDIVGETNGEEGEFTAGTGFILYSSTTNILSAIATLPHEYFQVIPSETGNTGYATFSNTEASNFLQEWWVTSS